MRTIRTSSPAYRLLLRYWNAYRPIFFYAILFLAGVLVGAIFIKTADQGVLQALARLIGSFSQRRQEQAVLDTFFSSFFSTGCMLLLLFLCGFCAVAQPVIVLLPFFRGLGFGYQAGYLYAQNGLTGVGYTALVLLPNMVLSTLILIYGCSEAFQLSTLYYRAARQEGGIKLNLRIYCAKFLFLGVAALFSSFLDAVCTLVFSGLFPVK